MSVTDLKLARRKKNRMTARENLEELRSAIKKTERVLAELKSRENFFLKILTDPDFNRSKKP